ncbi:hypothetical protein GCM10023189_17350 [Nibrella saemangeumensis]|uniref:pPIWI-RE three-gene island domain-containing protein n=1 Tax=Nibrella saemangeumensis TaxID=1084526 RepID=A0ABP8MQ36_9BACT
MSAKQLFDVELGLFLLAEFLPTAPPTALPDLLNGSDMILSMLTPRQRRYLKRGRDLLSHCRHHAVWHDLLERYATASNPVRAFDISRDRSRFNPQTVGFAWNRIVTLRQVLA